MRTNLVRIPTDDKLLLQGLFHEPDQNTSKAILFIHGVTGNFYQDRFLDAMANIFTNNGYAFIASNNRGHDYVAEIPVVGKKNEYRKIGSAYEVFSECIQDIKGWIDYIESKGYKEIILIGHSLGASKISYYQGKTQDKRVTKMVLMSPIPIITVVEADAQYKELQRIAFEMIKEGNGNSLMPKQLLGWILISPKAYLQYTQRGGEMDIFNIYDKDAPSVLSEIKTPVFAFWGSNDYLKDLVSLQETLELIKTKLHSSPRVDIDIIEGPGHSFEAFEEDVTNRVMDWILL
jgi:pimeloyl-ACP methyl ester carboxylesterase